ncbi:MAG TPA: protease modulator HflC [Pirellulales bacterium]|nr:protease modulator HflC [Pirellulales bacterium]
MHFIAFPHAHDEAAPSGRLWQRVGLGLFGLLLLWLASRTLFFVDETEYVYVTQFGEPLRLHSEPGLQWKWPYQSLWRFDRRLQIYEPPPREMLTQDKENLNFEWYVCWRIGPPSVGTDGQKTITDENRPIDVEPYVNRFLQSVGGVQAAESRLEERIQAGLAAEIGRTRLAELVSLEPDGVAIGPIMDRVTATIRQSAAEQFGIDVVDVRLKRFNYPDAVKPAVYAEIRSERQRVAVQYRAEGESEKIRIESRATLARDRLLAQARREATRLRGEGEAKAIEIYNSAHSQDPAFYRLLKTLDTYRAILDDQTTVVLSADSPLLKLLTHGLPNLPDPDYDQEQPAAGGTTPDRAARETVGGVLSGVPRAVAPSQTARPRGAGPAERSPEGRP